MVVRSLLVSVATHCKNGLGFSGLKTGFLCHRPSGSGGMLRAWLLSSPVVFVLVR
jgi:hypothetical protein